MNSARALDSIDIKLLEVLQERGRTKRNELAELTGLSLPAVSERLKKLESGGIIRGYHARLDHRLMGFDVSAFVTVTVDSSNHFDSFVGSCASTPEILECHAITGAGTHLLKVRVFNTKMLEALLSKIQSWSGVARTVTHIVLSSPKETCSVPVRIDSVKREA